MFQSNTRIIFLVNLKTDDEILAAFGADDSEDEKYDEADDAERRRDSTTDQGQSISTFQQLFFSSILCLHAE